MDHSLLFRGVTVALFCAFPVLMTYTYWHLRHHRREYEVKRVMNKLNIDENYLEAYQISYKSLDYVIAVLYTITLSSVGMVLVFFPAEVGLVEFPTVTIGDSELPQKGGRFVFAMAFCGAYLWGHQHIIWRYAQNDLLPVVFYTFSLRLVIAPLMALLVFMAFTALPGSDGEMEGGSILWPAIAFMIGIFPQRGLKWLSERLPIFNHSDDDVVNVAPLSLIEGVETHDALRLEEVGIDSCYDLACVDFVPLVLKTPYNARELIDWIMQAKLCVYVGPAILDLRKQGVRTILDLASQSEREEPGVYFDRLSSETSATRGMLMHAYNSIEGNEEIDRIRHAGLLLGKFTNTEEKYTESQAA